MWSLDTPKGVGGWFDSLKKGSESFQVQAKRAIFSFF